MPYPVQSVNGRRMPSTSKIRREYPNPKGPNDNHEIINYVFESWSQVQGAQKGDSKSNVTYYTPNAESNNKLANFTPFDLESWWAQQLVEKCRSRNS